MCFITRNPKLKKRQAKTDIKVKKIVNFDDRTKEYCYSKYYEYPYKKNVLNKEIDIKLECKGDVYNIPFYVGQEGYYSYSRNRCDCNALFIIPKGSYYYYSKINKEYISSNIVYKRRIYAKD